MADELQGKKIAILAADGVEQVELEQPREAVRKAGAEVELILLQSGEIQAMNHDVDRGTGSPSTRPSATPPPTTTTGCCCRAAPSTPTTCARTRRPSAS